MKIRNLSIVSVLAAGLMTTGAQAAVTVIGGGDAQSCYEAAENNWRPLDWISVCNFALQARQSDHDRAATLVNRGILKLALMNAQGAYNDFNDGLGMRADMAEGYVDRGASLIMLKRFAEALTDINKGLEMKAKKPQLAYYDRGLANEGLGDLPAAYADYKQAELIDPFFVQPARELKRFKVVIKPAGT